MNATTCLLLSVSSMLFAGAVHADGGTSKISAAALARGDAVIIGKLRRPLGTPRVVAGKLREPREAGGSENVLVVDEVSTGGDGPGTMALSMGVELEIRGLRFDNGIRYRLSGHESGEFVTVREDGVEQKDRTPALRFRKFFVATKVLEPIEALSRVSVADIKVTFAKDRIVPAEGVPKEARNARTGPDTTDHGPLSKHVDGKIAALKVTWANPARFTVESQAAAILRQCLSSPGGCSYTFQAWSQILAAPMLAANVEHVDGKPGRLLIWLYGETPAQDTAALYIYLDGDGSWWFGDWHDLTPNEMENETAETDD